MNKRTFRLIRLGRGCRARGEPEGYKLFASGLRGATKVEGEGVISRLFHVDCVLPQRLQTRVMFGTFSVRVLVMHGISLKLSKNIFPIRPVSLMTHNHTLVLKLIIIPVSLKISAI